MATVMNWGEAQAMTVSDAELERSQAAWAEVMRELRKARRLDYKEMKKHSGITGKAVRKIELRLSHPRQETLERLCRAYGVPFSVVAIVVELREEGIVVPIKRVYRLWRSIRRLFSGITAFRSLHREKKEL